MPGLRKREKNMAYSVNLIVVRMFDRPKVSVCRRNSDHDWIAKQDQWVSSINNISLLSSQCDSWILGQDPTNYWHALHSEHTHQISKWLITWLGLPSIRCHVVYKKSIQIYCKRMTKWTNKPSFRKEIEKYSTVIHLIARAITASVSMRLWGLGILREPEKSEENLEFFTWVSRMLSCGVPLPDIQ